MAVETFQDWIDREWDKIKEENPDASNEAIQKEIYNLFSEFFPGEKITDHQPYDTTSYVKFYNNWQKQHFPEAYRRYKGVFPIPYGSASKEIGKIQTRLAQNSQFKTILAAGTQSEPHTPIKNPVDSKYGPRTELALKTAIKLALNREKENPYKELTQKDFDDLSGQDPSKWKVSDDLVKKAAQKEEAEAPAAPAGANLKNVASSALEGAKKAASGLANKASDLFGQGARALGRELAIGATQHFTGGAPQQENYKLQDSNLKVIHNRNNKLEKLVFERMVKNAR